jgi:hypothetical protein
MAVKVAPKSISPPTQPEKQAMVAHSRHACRYAQGVQNALHDDQPGLLSI